MPEHVPTVVELAEMGEEFVVATDWVNDGTAKRPKWRATRWHVTPAGHAMMGAVMQRNALAAIAHGDGEWHQPPSSGALRTPHDEHHEEEL